MINENDLSYEDRIKKEKEEKKQITDRLNKILIKMDFKPILKEVDEYYTSHAEGEKDNLKIIINANEYRNKGKLSIMGLYPRNKKGEYIYTPSDLNFKEPKISLNKTDETIIKDINKRFMPYYIKRLNYIEQKIKEQNQKIEEKETLIKKISEFMNVKSYENKIYRYDYSKNINDFNLYVLYDNKIKIEIETNQEFIFKILELIKSDLILK